MQVLTFLFASIMHKKSPKNQDDRVSKPYCPFTTLAKVVFTSECACGLIARAAGTKKDKT